MTDPLIAGGRDEQDYRYGGAMRWTPEAAESAAKLAEDVDLHGNAYLPVPGLTPGQEIRIEALDSAVRYWAAEPEKVTPRAVLTVAERFAAYITDGTVEESR